MSLGEEFRNEFIMFSYDVPLSKRFVPNEIAKFAERGRRIMRTHPEFRYEDRFMVARWLQPYF